MIHQLAEEVARQLPNTLDLLRKMVGIESPSDDKAAVDRCAAFVAERCSKLGGHIRLHRQKEFGDLLEARFGPKKSTRKSILLLGHLDTVWPLGTLKDMPFRVDNERVWGPGVLDMKAGVALALTAIAILQEMKKLTRPIIMLLNSDEEVGSNVSRPVTEKLAKQCDAVFVLEPAQGSAGAYKTARKGVGNYSIRIQGVASHSGVDFERGHSAIVELARQIERITRFTELDRGITVNVGTVQGGTRSNVVAAEARAEVDVRIARAKDEALIDKHFRSLRVFDNKCSLQIEGGLNRPPMERTRGTVALFKRAASHARELGFTLEEAATGGGSDGNFTSALGVPTLDGMGAVGEGAHARHESLLLKHMAPRTALLAAMLADAGE
ncbi:M20 family metallopeptidase [Alloacidobacterium sp.]|uniref:M20 family metallopeptidase n=1 Tax=Alloacidobacterium sp. TaxID=2951999 RepID=UPI002D63021C|nr:M20 family metallopeptidase [Alloacidobacterium sp.]HYK37696.1 M20 family metallopeptidase [Alloacidobacterium sp.]